MILAVDMSGYSTNIHGVVLLDPTLTAKIPGQADTSIQVIANQIPEKGIPVFLGDTLEDGPITIPGVDTYRLYPEITHTGLAVNDTVFELALSILIR